MKKFFLFLALTTTGFFSFSQVSIGDTTPDPSAQLDVVAENRGLLIPRVALSSTDEYLPILGTAKVESLLVYNTATVNDVSPGYYYWDDEGDTGKWQRLTNITGPGDPRTSGAGGNALAGIAGDIYVDETTGEGIHSWRDIWTFPAIFAFAIMILFAIFFKNEKIEYKNS